MKPLDVRKYLFDILQACDLLERFTVGKTFIDYSADALLRSGVERQFAIVGEALGQALRADPDLAERVAGAARIIAFRNRLIHGYASVSNEVVWGVLKTHLPALRRDVEKLLAESAGDDEDGEK
jgi:uncharacterized protein with HEPN domain